MSPRPTKSRTAPELSCIITDIIRAKPQANQARANGHTVWIFADYSLKRELGTTNDLSIEH